MMKLTGLGESLERPAKACQSAEVRIGVLMFATLTHDGGMRTVFGAVALLIMAFLAGACAVPPNEMAHLPMYGGMDRQAVLVYRSADERLITGSIEAFGSREQASTVSIEHGFKFLAQKEYSMAIKRFNHAWILSPDNPHVYLGVWERAVVAWETL